MIIKPNAMKKNLAGAIIKRFEEEGFHLRGMKLMKISSKLCEVFYEEHKNRPFFSELVSFMSSAPVLVLALSGSSAVAKARSLMGHTDPQKAEKGTLRFEYGDSVGENAVHGSDSPESAKRELNLFFQENELYV